MSASDFATTSGTLDLAQIGTFAAELADAVRPIALHYFRSNPEIETKGDGSPVTIADQTIEQELRRRIAARYPDHGIYGEEFGAEIRAATWVVDPIDGTKSFVTGMPLFGTLIALCQDGRPVAGLVDMPALAERWIGTGAGTTLNGAPARTSACSELAAARLYTTSPDAFSPDGLEALAALSAGVALRRFGGDCYAYGLLASGHCDLVLEEGLKPYDWMALVPVIEGAGGVITDWEGSPLTFDSVGQVLAAATPHLHAQALRVCCGYGAAHP